MMTSMIRRMVESLLAALAAAVASVATASAAPIVVGQWTWTGEDFGAGPEAVFTVTNSSAVPLAFPSLESLAPGQGWQSGTFTNIVITLTPVDACPVLNDCSVTIADIAPGASDFNLEMVELATVVSATLSLDFLGQMLTSTISRVGDGGLLIHDFTPAPAPVPEPMSVALFVLGSAAWLTRRLHSRL